MKGNFSEILKKYYLKCRYAHNFRKFQVSYVSFIAEILQQIFQNFTNMSRKSEKLKKRKKENCYAVPLSHHRITVPSPVITLWLPPFTSQPRFPFCHNGNLNACEWKTSRLCHAATISIIVCTTPPLSATTIYFRCIFHYAPVF